MTEKEFEKIILNGESASVEFKVGIPRPDILARLIAAFANTNGGRIFFGIREPKDIVGAPQKQRLDTTISIAKKMLAEKVETKTSFFDYQGKNIGILTVEKADKLISLNGSFYKRDSHCIRAMHAPEIQSHFKLTGKNQEALKQLSEAVAKQTDVIENLRIELAKANSPIRKAIYAILGAIASPLIKDYLIPLIKSFWT